MTSWYEFVEQRRQDETMEGMGAEMEQRWSRDGERKKTFGDV